MQQVAVLDAMKREWERTILFTMLSISAVGLLFAGYKAIEFTRKESKAAPSKVRVATLFDDEAFAFLEEDAPKTRIPLGHAMTAKAPQSWITELQRRAFLERRKRNLGGDRREYGVVAPKKTEPEPTKTEPKKAEPKPERKPNPPIDHYIAFKGYYTATTGETVVLLERQDRQQSVTKKASPTFISKNKDLEGYSLEAMNSDNVVLRKEGKTYTVDSKSPFKYATTTDPPNMLEPDAPKQPKAPGGGSILNKVLKNNGKNIDLNQVQKLLKNQTIDQATIDKIRKQFEQNRKNRR